MTPNQTPKSDDANSLLTELRDQFAYHRPPNEAVSLRHEAVRAAALELAEKLVELTPPGRARERALEACREAMFWANGAIACRPLDPTGAGQ